MIWPKAILVLMLSGVVVGSGLVLKTQQDLRSTVLPLGPDQEWSLWLKSDPSRAYQVFSADQVGFNEGKQHLAAHVFGEELFSAVGVSGIRVCDRRFSFGCYHGFFSAAIAAEGVAVIPELDQACRVAFEVANPCQHGLGHGLVEYFGSSKLDQALAGCDFADRSDPISGCPSGVYMEYNFPVLIDGQGAELTTRSFEPAAPYDPCPDVPARFSESCYHELPQWWLQVYSTEFSDLIGLCQNIAEDKHRAACYEGVGAMTASGTDYDPREAAEICFSIVEPAGQRRCHLAAREGFFFSDRHFLKVEQYCQLVGTPEACLDQDRLMQKQNQLQAELR